MTSDSDRKAAEEYAEKLYPDTANRASLSYSENLDVRLQARKQIADAYLAGRSSSLKELEQVAREAFRAGKERSAWEIVVANWTYQVEEKEPLSEDDYWQKKTESKETE